MLRWHSRVCIQTSGMPPFGPGWGWWPRNPPGSRCWAQIWTPRAGTAAGAGQRPPPAPAFQLRPPTRPEGAASQRDAPRGIGHNHGVDRQMVGAWRGGGQDGPPAALRVPWQKRRRSRFWAGWSPGRGEPNVGCWPGGKQASESASEGWDRDQTCKVGLALA